MKIRDKYKPAVPKSILLFLAGFTWICVGTMLLFLAFSWLPKNPAINNYLFVGAGLALALVAHHFGFLKIVDKNLERLLPLQEKQCLFSFIPLKSYLIIVIMIALGAMLRHSMIPKLYLVTLYTTIGAALLLSSIRYMRIFFQEIRKHKPTL